MREKQRRRRRIASVGAAISSPDQFGLLPGADLDHFSSPDSAAASITGAIEIHVEASMDDWTPAGSEVFVGKWLASSQQSYVFEVTATAGIPIIFLSANGSSALQAQATAAPGFTDGTKHWLRTTWDPATDFANFYTGENGSDWDLLGTADRPLTAGGIFDSTANLGVGSNSNGTESNFNGKIYRVRIFDGIGGTLVVDFNADDWTSGATWNSSTTSEEWTINNNASISS